MDLESLLNFIKFLISFRSRQSPNAKGNLIIVHIVERSYNNNVDQRRRKSIKKFRLHLSLILGTHASVREIIHQQLVTHLASGTQARRWFSYRDS